MSSGFKSYKILSIDTSCDETSASVTNGLKILSNIQPSQMKIHSEFGGVVPSLAKLEHKKKIHKVVDRALKQSGTDITQLDAIAVTYGPGLAIALEIGINKAKEIANQITKPLITINHMEGHLLSSFGQRNAINNHLKDNTESKDLLHSYDIKFPNLGILVSGGHSEFILVKDFCEYEKIGETLDDSCGECFDKCARIMGIGYPGGPVISDFAKRNRKNIKIEFFRKNTSLYARVLSINRQTILPEMVLPVPMSNSGDFNLSFSGLKTAFSDLYKKISEKQKINKEIVMSLSNLIEAVAYKQICMKIEKILENYSINEIWLGGGVVASSKFRSTVRAMSRQHNLTLRFPFSKRLTTDNAAMIGIAANFRLNKFGFDGIKHGIYVNSKDFDLIDRDPSLSL